MVSYRDPNVNVEIKYSVEYIPANNKTAWESELYTTHEFDSLDDAIPVYMANLFMSHDTKMFQTVYVNGENVREGFVVLPITTESNLANIINSDLKVCYDTLLEDNKVLAPKNKLYEAFIKKYNAEELFKKFMKEQEEK